MTLEEIEERVTVTDHEILAALNQSNPLLVQATAEHLQNQKMKALLNEMVDGDENESPEED